LRLSKPPRTPLARAPGPLDPVNGLAIINGLIFNGETGSPTEDCIRVAGGRIAELGGRPHPADRVIDARGCTVVPGLIDAHVHAYGVSLSLLDNETSASAISRWPEPGGWLKRWAAGSRRFVTVAAATLAWPGPSRRG
jgi:predicted amidohydrolase YtcJ